MKKIILTLLSIVALNAQAKHIQLSPDNTATLRGVVDFDSVNSVQQDLQNLIDARGNKEYPIYLVIDSPGGSIEAGFSFLEYARPLKNVHTITLFGASMASAIAMQLPGKRYVTDSGLFMFHRAYAQIAGQVEVGELETSLALVKSRVRRLENANAKRLKLSIEEYKKRVVNEWWADSDQALEQGIADEKVSLSCTKELVNKSIVQIMRSLFGIVESKSSACPLFR